MDREFEPHEIAWTTEKASRLWDYYSCNPGYEGPYFSRTVGESTMRFVRRCGMPMRGRVLDFGCGPGFFLEKLAAMGIPSEGADFSTKAVDAARKRMSGNRFFRGAVVLEGMPTQFAEGTFDVVFLHGVIEHLLAEEFDASMSEMHRIVRTGGVLVVTTANEEFLDASKVLCPECGCVFHRVQHQTSWSCDSLSSTMSSSGFDTVVCAKAFLTPASMFHALRRIVAKIRREKMPHIIYIGRKRGQRQMDSA